MQRGYVNLWRKLLDSDIFADPIRLKVFIWCLCKASHKERTVSVRIGAGFETVKITPGQFVFGRTVAARELGLSASTVYRRVNALKRTGILNMQPNTHYSIVTICNWNRYQTVKN